MREVLPRILEKRYSRALGSKLVRFFEHHDSYKSIPSIRPSIAIAGMTSCVDRYFRQQLERSVPKKGNGNDVILCLGISSSSSKLYSESCW